MYQSKWLKWKTLKIPSAGKDMEQLGFSYTSVGM